MLIMLLSYKTLAVLKLWNNMLNWFADGTEVIYTNWKYNEPNTYQEKCMIMIGHTGEWNDDWCHTPRLVLCEGGEYNSPYVILIIRIICWLPLNPKLSGYNPDLPEYLLSAQIFSHFGQLVVGGRMGCTGGSRRSDWGQRRRVPKMRSKLAN